MALSTTEVGKQKTSVAFKRTLLFVILPALVAGFFSIAPKLYDVFIKDRTALSYQLISGPTIPLSDGFRRIFSIQLQNDGKVPLTLVKMEVHERDGIIETLVAEKSMLQPTIFQTPPSMTVERMLPKERVNASVMVKSSATDPMIDVNARSDQVLAVASNPEQSRTESGKMAAFGAILSSISVGFMSYFFFLIRSSDFSEVNIKPDNITFIAGLSGVIPMSDQLLITEHKMSYARLGDAFLFAGSKGDERTRSRCAPGLRSLLLIHNMAERSIQKIRHNLKVLDYDITDEKFDELRREAGKADGLQTRQNIIDQIKKNARRRMPAAR